MKKHNEYTEMGLRALRRAVEKVYEDARRHNLKIPIWRNNRVEYLDPSKGFPQIKQKTIP